MSWEPFFKQYGKAKIDTLVSAAYAQKAIFPKREDVFKAYEITPPEAVKVVILGQDPYILPGQAHGLAFSIYSDEAKVPPTLKNIFKELENEFGSLRDNTNLTDWAKQGVFLLNTILTVEAGKSLSHKNIGWQDLTTQTVQYLNTLNQPICYILLGNDAKKYATYITNPKALILDTAHPSPLAAYRGFFGSDIFKKTNTWLQQNELNPIHWI